MKTSVPLLSFFLALLGTPAGAQIILDDFTTGIQPREGAALGSWVGQVTPNTTQNATTLTVAGTAHDDNGWGVFNLPSFDASAMQSITVTGRLDAGHSAGSFNIQFFDESLGAQVFSISSSSFITGSFTTVSLPLGPWVTADPTRLNGWTIGGGNFVATGPDFRMTLDQLALSPVAVPEPHACAALAGILALGFSVWQRRRTAA